MWHYNQVSITRRGQSEYEFGICTPGFIYNLHNAYDVVMKEGANMELVAENMLETAFSCYIYYNIALAKNIPYAKEIEQLSRKYYLAYYNKCLPFISIFFNHKCTTFLYSTVFGIFPLVISLVNTSRLVESI